MSKPSRPDLATNHLRTAAAQSPDDPEIHYNLGAVLEACEELQEALQAYQRAYDGGIEVCAYTWSERQADISARDAKHPKLYGQADSCAPEGRGQVERAAKRQPPERCWERVALLGSAVKKESLAFPVRRIVGLLRGYQGVKRSALLDIQGINVLFELTGVSSEYVSSFTYLGLELLVKGIQEFWVHKKMRFIQIHNDAWHLLIDGQDELLDSCIALGSISTASHG